MFHLIKKSDDKKFLYYKNQRANVSMIDIETATELVNIDAKENKIYFNSIFNNLPDEKKIGIFNFLIKYRVINKEEQERSDKVKRLNALINARGTKRYYFDI